ncbi:hypothetical protein MKW98_009361 [Papaver atlanticum]|uniref:Protein FAR1-RELATED SEQUENCE n=1 Tax=Papaver atlanticum TaxID=357466 RepID=A0AAD4RYP0_9MAGN|nr:hypothetical protein MKW98_009361 [Papaver atlanticum]
MDVETSNKETTGVGDAEVVIDENKESEIIEPKVGTMFNSVDEIYDFFRNYGYHMGFPVKKRTTKKSIDGILRYVTFTCGRAGKGESSSNNLVKPPTCQIGCKVKLTASLCGENKWRINTVNLEHNHGLCPSQAAYFRCNWQFGKNKKMKPEGGSRGANENVSNMERECKSCSEIETLLQLGEGDAFAMQEFFMKMQTRSKDFFYSMDLDEDGRLRNAFWADGRSREAYKEFGEVVYLDTSFLANKYNIQLTSFVGVNHHGNLTLFGCGLVSSGDTGTYVWLFRTWMECMSNRAPEGIITDQDTAIKIAVEVVFPTIRHQWCLYHLMKKMPEKLGELYDSISTSLQEVVYDTQSPTEFEQSWNELVEKHGLHHDEWLTGLYNGRDRWVPCFVKSNFWAGISATKRDDSINSFFDGFVNSKTTLKKFFVEQYDKALKSEVEKESQLDFRSFAKTVPCITTYEMEKQVQRVYTISKFKEFQKELTGKMYCDVISIQEGFMVSEYHIREDIVIGEAKKRMRFTISFQKNDCEVNCSCLMFQFGGILCRHAIYVLIRNDIMLLPDSYILSRWRKDVRRYYTRVKINDSWSATPEQLQYDELCLAFAKLAHWVAGDKESCRHVLEWINNQKTTLATKRLSCESNPAQK